MSVAHQRETAGEEKAADSDGDLTKSDSSERELRRKVDGGRGEMSQRKWEREAERERVNECCCCCKVKKKCIYIFKLRL